MQSSDPVQVNRPVTGLLSTTCTCSMREIMQHSRIVQCRYINSTIECKVSYVYMFNAADGSAHLSLMHVRPYLTHVCLLVCTAHARQI